MYRKNNISNKGHQMHLINHIETGQAIKKYF